MPRNRRSRPVQGRRAVGRLKPHRRQNRRSESIPGGYIVPTVSELMRDQAGMDVVFDDDMKVHVEYRPRVITTAWQNAINEAEQQGAGDAAILFQPLRDAIISWDLEKTTGTTYGMEDEEMATIPRQILNQILFSLVTTARPNQTRPPVLSTGGSSVRSITTKRPAKD